jgi:hypothetical protein
MDVRPNSSSSRRNGGWFSRYKSRFGRSRRDRPSASHTWGQGMDAIFMHGLCVFVSNHLKCRVAGWGVFHSKLSLMLPFVAVKLCNARATTDGSDSIAWQRASKSFWTASEKTIGAHDTSRWDRGDFVDIEADGRSITIWSWCAKIWNRFL